MDHGGVLQMGLQLMLMQCEDREIRLLPAWPKEWDTDFKLHAPYQTTVEGTSDTSYNLTNFHVSAHNPTVNVPVLWWRSVGNTHTAFVMETLIDELATRAKMDPIAYRRKLLKPEAKKLRAALDLMDQQSAWRNNW